MARHAGRRAARHGAPPEPGVRGLITGRPALLVAMSVGIVLTTTAGVSGIALATPETDDRPDFVVSTLALRQAGEQSDLHLDDVERLVKDRGSLNAARASERYRIDEAERERAAAEEKARQEARAKAEAEAKAAAEAKARAAAEAKARAAAEAKAKAERERRAKQSAAALTAPMNSSPSGNRALGRALLSSFGFGDDQWGCLDRLFYYESKWNHLAQNPSSGAYGIPQALPGSKMSTYGSDWRTNPETQIKWGLAYIKSRYGTPCGALSAFNSRSPHWY